jgi:hypothetical protein
MADIDRRDTATSERTVRLETKMDLVLQRLDHQDKCVDALKRQVWLAAGAIGLLFALVNMPLVAKMVIH